MNKYSNFLISLADQLDREGKIEKADEIDKDFQEWLKLLENGKLVFDFTFSQDGGRDVRNQRSNKGRGLNMYEMAEGGR